MQGACYQEAMGMKSLKMQTLSRCKRHTKLYGPANMSVQKRRIVPRMEFRVNSRLILARYRVCTKARCILSGSYGHEEFINVNPVSVQKAHKTVRAGQYLRPIQCRIVPSVEIRVYSRLILARYKSCTN